MFDIVHNFEVEHSSWNLYCYVAVSSEIHSFAQNYPWRHQTRERIGQRRLSA